MRQRTGVVLGAAAVLLVTGLAVWRTDVSDRVESPSGASASSPSAPAQLPSASRGPDVLLPNLRSLGARDLHLERANNQRRLRFAALLGNTGRGPLVVRPRRSTGMCPSDQLRADQLLHEDSNGNGTFERRHDLVGQRRPTGCMLDHRGHDHWHFDAMAAYSLRRPGSSEPLVRRHKVSFCLRDNERIPDQSGVAAREHYGECERNGVQGISAGWADVYSSDLDGQWLRLPREVGVEVLCLDLEADPLDLLEETDEADNATSVAFRLDGTRVRRAAPRLCR